MIRTQSPDEYLLEPAPGPVWTYPSRRAPQSVPVPPFRGSIDAAQVPASRDRVARRTESAGSDTLLAARPARSAAIQNRSDSGELPPLPSYRANPFRETGPACPINPSPCSPIYSSPFEDPCGMVGDGAWSYSWDNIYFFALFDAFRLHGENTRFGGRFGLNWGLPLIDDDSGLAWQGGFSGSAAEEGPQWFVTTGVFYRGDMRIESSWNFGAVIDWMRDDEFGSEVGQIRVMTSVTLNGKNEVGVWGAAGVFDDDDRRGRTIESVDQVNLFYRYLLDSGWDLSASVGWRSEPDSLALGGQWYAPLNYYWAAIVGGYYAFEGDTWNVYTGLIRHWGDRARQDYLGQHRHLPYLPVADNSSLTLF